MSSPGPALDALGGLSRLIVTLKSVRGGSGAAENLHQIHKSLSHGLDNLDEHRYMRAAHPAVGVVVLGGAAALAPLIAILVVVVLVVVGVACLVIYGDRIEAWGQRMMLDVAMRANISVAQARARLMQYEQENPLSADCKRRFDALIVAIDALIRFANATPTSSQPGLAWINRAKELGQAIEAALRGLAACIDPAGTTGLLGRFTGPNGLIEMTFRNLKKLLIEP